MISRVGFMRGVIGAEIIGGVAKALSVGMQMPQLPEMRVSRSVHRHEAIRSTPLHGQHGKRERERRQRQIAKGSLKAENGLVQS